MKSLTVKFSDAFAFVFCLIVLLAMLLCPCVSKAQGVDWTDKNYNRVTQGDIYRQAAVTGLLVLDYGQTMDAYDRRTDGYGETNPIVRGHYSPAGIRNYFLVVGVGHAAIARALPAKYRPAWQYAAIIIESIVIIHNKRVGAHFEF